MAAELFIGRFIRFGELECPEKRIAGLKEKAGGVRRIAFRPVSLRGGIFSVFLIVVFSRFAQPEQRFFHFLFSSELHFRNVVLY